MINRFHVLKAADPGLVEYFVRNINHALKILEFPGKVNWQAMIPVISMAVSSTVIGAVLAVIQYKLMEQYYIRAVLVTVLIGLAGSLYLLYLHQVQYRLSPGVKSAALYWMLTGLISGHTLGTAVFEPEMTKKAQERLHKKEL